MRPLPGTWVALGVTVGAGPLAFIVGALVAAAVASYLLTPVAIRMAVRSGAIDMPDAGRRVHRRPIPRGGGLAVVVAFVGVGIVASVLSTVVMVPNVLPQLPPVSMSSSGGANHIDPKQLVALFGGVLVAAAFGFADDRWQVRARWQLLEQLALAVIAIVGGIVITAIANPFDFLGKDFGGAQLDDFSPVVSVVLTALWIVGMVNSVNFIDGLDGLSTGVSLIAALTLGVISLIGSQSQPMVALLCALLAGSLAGFLPWNFHPARVFIGTTGVFAVGYALAVLSVLGVGKVAVALLVLGVPIIDTFWIILRRLRAGRSPFTPDRGHFHHRLLDLGLTHRGAVLLIYAICILLGILSLVLSGGDRRQGSGAALGAAPIYAFMGVVVGGGLVLYLLTRRSRDALDARSYPDDHAQAPPADAVDDDAGSRPAG